jgi:gamma-D-glutamyl-L-lysine dipeptidyl-peptidase
MKIYRIAEAVVPVHKEPSHRAEMVNELLYGEDIIVLENINGWLSINCVGYEYGGVIPEITKKTEVLAEVSVSFRFVYTAAGIIILKEGNRFDVVRGSRIYETETETGCFRTPDKISSMGEIPKTARFYLGCPYRWGGRSPFGIDCSGFTQMVFMLNGMILPRDAHQQVQLGNEVAFVSEAQPGDLAFFQNENGDVVHTGIMLSNSEIIHASGRVRTDSIDHHGIFNKELNRYTHTLKVLKRMSADVLPACM